MGTEAFVELVCPDCRKHWESTPSKLPAPDKSFDCPDCGTRRRLAEFTRTSLDLEVVRDATSRGSAGGESS